MRQPHDWYEMSYDQQERWRKAEREREDLEYESERRREDAERAQRDAEESQRSLRSARQSMECEREETAAEIQGLRDRLSSCYELVAFVKFKGLWEEFQAWNPLKQEGKPCS